MRIMSVGVFQHGRGAVPLIESLAHLPENHIVELVGPIPQPDYEARMREAAAPFGDRVIFTGHVPAPEVVPRLATAKLSAVLFEGLSGDSYRLVSPNKLFDSMAAGTPIIASDLPVVGGTATREGMGVICNPDDPADIARAIREAVPRIAEMRPRARDAASRNNWDLEQKKLVALYERLG
jgi:glycosyltransferase involved in cell wall biosynthesis